MEFTGEIVPLLILLGGVLFLVGNRLLIGRSLSRDLPRTHFLEVGICAALFIVARIVQRTAVEPTLASLGVRLQYAIGIAIICVGIVDLPNTLSPAVRRRQLISLFAASGALVIFLFAGDLIVTWEARHRIDLLGHRYLAAVPGPLIGLIGGFFVGAALVAWRHLRTAAPTRHSPRSRYIVVACVMGMTGLNDILMSAGVITSIHLFEYSFALLTLLATYQEQYRLDALNTQLETVLATRAEELERALVELTEKERHFRDLAQATGEGVLLIENERIARCNHVVQVLTGRSSDELVGQPVVDLFETSDHDAITWTLATSDQRPREARLVRAGQPALVVEISATPSTNTNRGVLLIRDLSPQREMQHRLIQTDRLAAMGTLAAGTAHEINNPLAFVICNAEFLAAWLDDLDGKLAPAELQQPRELVAEILDGSTRVARIVKDLTSLARDQPGDRGPADLVATLESSLNIAAPQIRHRARLIRDWSDVPKVAGSPLRLSQVFLNLLINAAHAIPEGAIDDNEIRIRVRQRADVVRVEIEDTGVGIPEAVRHRIFDPFFTTKSVGQGTGLGLSVSHGIITSLGGKIEVHPVAPRGTCFVVEVPIVVGDAVPVEPLQIALSDRVHKKILIADDEPGVCKVLGRVLADYEVATVHDGQSVVDRCRHERFDLIICDLMMPKLTGMEVYDQLLQLRPGLARRMLFITGGVFTERARAFLEAHAPDWLSKPIGSTELRLHVQRILEHPHG